MQHCWGEKAHYSASCYFRVGDYIPYSLSMRCSAFTAVIFFRLLQPSFVIFLNTQQLAGRKPAERGLIVVLELHVICNCDSKPTWSAELGQSRK